VQCFLRVANEKLPYAKRAITIKHQEEDRETPVIEEMEDFADSSNLIFPPITNTNSAFVENLDEEEAETPFDPLADAPDLTAIRRQPRLVLSPLLLGAGLLGIVVFGVAGYLLTRPCVMFACQELETATQLRTESRQLMSRAKSENELLAVKQKLDATSAALTIIPQWSPHHQQAEELKTSLATESNKINQVVTALQTGAQAEQKTQTTTNSLEELQARQHLWRQAIIPLETVNPHSEFYNFIQPKLLKYRINLQTVNKQLLVQEQWLKKLTAAKEVASVAVKRQTAAKSLSEWQKVQSTWQIAVNALSIIPQTSPAYPDAQKLLIEYKPQLARARDRVTLEQLAAKSYQQAISIAKQAKAYEKLNQWQAAAAYWNQALQTAKNVSQDSLYYTQAQSLIAPYSQGLKQAEGKAQLTNTWQQTRVDLNKICVEQIRICNFTINNTGIVVKTTLEYEQAIQGEFSQANPENPDPAINATNHWQVLQEALTVISENANLPLVVYDSQGQEIYIRTSGS
jgi:tetratricopeptide (TPR) repeat protein